MKKLMLVFALILVVTGSRPLYAGENVGTTTGGSLRPLPPVEDSQDDVGTGGESYQVARPTSDYYLIINKASGKALDGGGNGGALAYPHPSPYPNNDWILWSLVRVGDYYLILNKPTGNALDAGGGSGSTI